MGSVILPGQTPQILKEERLVATIVGGFPKGGFVRGADLNNWV